jgi:hypothetical protein
MGSIKEEIESIGRFLDNVSKITWMILSWFFYLTLTAVIFLGEYDLSNNDNLKGFVIGTSIWLWVTVRWLKKKGYLTFKRNVNITTVGNEFKFFPFLLKSIVAPIVVSLVIFSVTGEASVTLISVPILGFLSASIST